MTKGHFSGGEAGGLVQGGGQGWIGSALPMASSIVVFDEWEVKLRTQKRYPNLLLDGIFDGLHDAESSHWDSLYQIYMFSSSVKRMNSEVR